jgi:transcriptional regulator with XRE-family HTH domain
VTIGKRLRALRKEKKFSQREIGKKTGLHRGSISRLENGLAAPSTKTLEKMARALEIPMYRLFYNGKNSKLPATPKRETADDLLWGSAGKDAQVLLQFCRLFDRMKEGEREVIILMAQRMVR